MGGTDSEGTDRDPRQDRARRDPNSPTKRLQPETQEVARQLGTRGCKAAYLDDFLAAIECDNPYLVGDIIDGRAMSRGTIYFPRHFNWLRGKFGAPYWSLSAYVKNRVKQALEFIDSFEETLARECASRGYDGVVCGHIHKAVMKTVGGVLYCNDGDWVESCTALVEHDDGRLEIIQWHIVSHEGAAKAATAAVVDTTA